MIDHDGKKVLAPLMLFGLTHLDDGAASNLGVGGHFRSGGGQRSLWLRE